jgi:hypothetical protein
LNDMFLYTVKSAKNKFVKCKNKIVMIFFCRLHSLNNGAHIIDNIMLWQQLINELVKG